MRDVFLGIALGGLLPLLTGVFGSQDDYGRMLKFGFPTILVLVLLARRPWAWLALVAFVTCGLFMALFAGNRYRANQQAVFAHCQRNLRSGAAACPASGLPYGKDGYTVYCQGQHHKDCAPSMPPGYPQYANGEVIFPP